MSGYSNESLAKMLENGMKERHCLDARFRKLCRAIRELGEVYGTASQSATEGCAIRSHLPSKNGKSVFASALGKQTAAMSYRRMDRGAKRGSYSTQNSSLSRSEGGHREISAGDAERWPEKSNSETSVSILSAASRRERPGRERRASFTHEVDERLSQSDEPSHRHETASYDSGNLSTKSNVRDTRRKDSAPSWRVRRLVLDESADESIHLVKEKERQQQPFLSDEEKYSRSPSIPAMVTSTRRTRKRRDEDTGETVTFNGQTGKSGQDEGTVSQQERTAEDSDMLEEADAGGNRDDLVDYDLRRDTSVPSNEKTRGSGKSAETYTMSCAEARSNGDESRHGDEDSIRERKGQSLGMRRSHNPGDESFEEAEVSSDAGLGQAIESSTRLEYANSVCCVDDCADYQQHGQERRCEQSSPRYDCRGFEDSDDPGESSEQHRDGDEENGDKWRQRGRILWSLHAEPAARVAAASVRQPNHASSRPGLFIGPSTIIDTENLKPYHGLYARSLKANGLNPTEFVSATTHCHPCPSCDCRCDRLCRCILEAKTGVVGGEASSETPNDDIDHPLLKRGARAGEPFARDGARMPVDGLPDRLETGRVLDSLTRRAELIGAPRPTPLRAKAAWMEMPGYPDYRLLESTEGLLSSFCRRRRPSGSDVPPSDEIRTNRRRDIYASAVGNSHKPPAPAAATTLMAAADAWNEGYPSDRRVQGNLASRRKFAGGCTDNGGKCSESLGRCGENRGGCFADVGGVELSQALRGSLGDRQKGGETAATGVISDYVEYDRKCGGEVHCRKHVTFANRARFGDESPRVSGASNSDSREQRQEPWRVTGYRSNTAAPSVGGAARFIGRHALENDNPTSSRLGNTSSRADAPRNPTRDEVLMSSGGDGVRNCVEGGTGGGRGNIRRRFCSGDPGRQRSGNTGGKPSAFGQNRNAWKEDPAWASTADFFYSAI